MRAWSREIGAFVAFAFLSACNSDENAPPIAHDAEFTASEDQSFSGQLTGKDPEGQTLYFALGSAQHGTVTSLSSDGAFTFEPEADFYGTARFTFFVADDEGQVARATASILVENVNDPPELSPVPDLTNSAETEIVHYQLAAFDPDPDPLGHAFSISVDDPTIVEASIDRELGSVSLKALRPGATDIEVAVSDADFTDMTQFRFSADEVRKGRILRYEETATGAVVLENEADRPIDFVLEHNGFPVFEDVASIVRYVQALPSEFEGEDFPRKLWRFVRDSVYHEITLQTDTRITNRIFYDPWFTLNSLGWGLCGHVSGVYVVIARAAGYEARVWGLDGHVVPEIKVNGRWRMYDPDLSVYYKNVDGSVAGVEELAANPYLITSPVDPIFAGSQYRFPYHAFIAGIYSSTSNNYDAENVFLPVHQTPSARITLPARAKLTYPGRWTGPPTGRDGALIYDVRAYRQALIELPEGWTGEVKLPWMAWAMTGSGQVGIDGRLFVVGSPELQTRLRDTPRPITSLQVYANGGIRIVLFINAARFDIRPRTTVAVRGFDVWAIRMNGTQLALAEGGGGALDASLRKPVSVVP